LVIPADVPAVTSADISALAREHGTGRAITLVADRRGVGTNALLASPPDACPFLFGEDSFARHQQAARDAGIEPLVVDTPGLRYDVDVESDLDAIAMQSPGRETSELLRRFGRVVAPARQNELAASGERP
jgi:2-phospho-L-lactate guanylyltransferase